MSDTPWLLPNLASDTHEIDACLPMRAVFFFYLGLFGTLFHPIPNGHLETCWGSIIVSFVKQTKEQWTLQFLFATWALSAPHTCEPIGTLEWQVSNKMHFFVIYDTHADSFLRQCHQSFDPNMQPAVPRSRNQQPKDWDMHRAFKRCCLTLMVLSLPARHLCLIAQRAWESDTLRWRS